MILGEISKGRDNNLNLIRLIAAVMVVLCHAFPIALGATYADPLSTISHGQTSLGNLAVCIFFFYGGFLIAGSVVRSKTGKNFFKKRLVRLFPSLIAVVLLCVLVIGPLYTDLKINDYFSNVETYKYFLNMLLIPVHNLPGVFVNNIYGQTVNGSLWTLPVEFMCYVLCFLLFQMKVTDQKKMKYTMLLFIPGYIGMNILLIKNPLLKEALRPMGMFYVGMLCYIYRDKIKVSGWVTIIMAAILCAAVPFGMLEYPILIAFPYILLYLGFGVKKVFCRLQNMSDISYQLYLVAWPIQQLVCQYHGGTMNPWKNAMISLVIGTAAAILLSKGIDQQLERHRYKTA